MNTLLLFISSCFEYIRDSLLSGIISGVIACIVFSWLIRLCAPRAKASPVIIVNNGLVSIKLLNMTWYKSLIDVQAQLSFVTRSYRDDGHIASHNTIKLRKDYLFEMYSFKLGSTEGAWIFRSAEMFTGVIDEVAYFRFRVLASEPTFGIRKSFTFDYHKDKIIRGNYDFKSGRSLDFVATIPKTTTPPSSPDTP